MKNFLKAFTGILVLSLLLISCKKDKDKGPTNYFKVGDTTYEVTGGVMENYGTEDWYDGYNIDLTLITSGIDVDEYGDWTGSGKAIYFEVFSTSSSYLPSGEYVFDDTSNPYPTFSFDHADYCINWTESTHTWIDITAGTLTITRSGSNYTIDLTGGIDESSNAVTAHYSGTLEYNDYDVKKTAKTRH